MSATIHTIGHSTRTTEELIGLLRGHGVDLLVDVRRFPASRRHPHFNREPLARALEEAGIEYRHEEGLGGRRHEVREDSPNAAWRNRGFQAYADHTDSEAFREALARVEEAAGEGRRPAVMCAEIVPWRCHRRIISDTLVARGHEVRHIIDDPATAERHELDEIARVVAGGRVVYPEEEPDQLEML